MCTLELAGDDDPLVEVAGAATPATQSYAVRIAGAQAVAKVVVLEVGTDGDPPLGSEGVIAPFAEDEILQTRRHKPPPPITQIE